MPLGRGSSLALVMLLPWGPGRTIVSTLSLMVSAGCRQLQTPGALLRLSGGPLSVWGKCLMCSGMGAVAQGAWGLFAGGTGTTGPWGERVETRTQTTASCWHSVQ